jgi:ATP-dependent Clp protease ATP-binding subunit ClpA
MSFPARMWLANRGYEAAYRARLLKHVILLQVQNPLAEEIWQVA